MTATAESDAGGPPVAARFLEALATRDWIALEGCLDPGLWMRQLLPRRIVDVSTAADAVAEMKAAFDGHPEVRIIEMEHEPSLGVRERVRFRFRLRPTWEPDVWHTIEQVGEAKVVGDRITRLDLVCTGFLPDE